MTKDIAYFQQIENKYVKGKGANKSSYQINPVNKTPRLYDARIKPKDLLSITVVSTVPEASRMYNLIVPQVIRPDQSSILSEPTLQTYLVDNDGSIDFPVFGKINVIGLTTKELQNSIQKKLASAFSNELPIVTVRITNYTINILGEVTSPGKFITTNDRMTIFDGLALAGDMTIYGRRDNVKILRENADGVKEYITLNLNDKNVIYSPAYYLEQNDVVYVEPNNSKSRSSNYGAAETFGITTLSVLLTLTSLILTIF
ncbi:MAG: polysaccharide biosynthesis/export family protein [Paludibacter sp.]|nr:polysaccharide biosynthesis/export family protein [Paludibacter sp.]